MKNIILRQTFKNVLFLFIIFSGSLSAFAAAPRSGEPLVNGESPVSLTSFSAHPSKKAVMLEWSTDRETNTNYFILQRSLDGKQFTEIAMIVTGEDSYTDKVYKYSDDRTVRGRTPLYYRLKIVDRDGQHVYSSVRMISSEKMAEIYY